MRCGCYVIVRSKPAAHQRGVVRVVCAALCEHVPDEEFQRVCVLVEERYGLGGVFVHVHGVLFAVGKRDRDRRQTARAVEECSARVVRICHSVADTFIDVLAHKAVHGVIRARPLWVVDAVHTRHAVVVFVRHAVIRRKSKRLYNLCLFALPSKRIK